MKTNKLFLTLLTCLFASSLSATIHTINSGFAYYAPNNLTINLGDTVEWINDSGNHDVNADINSQTGLSFNNPVSFQSNTINVIGAIIHTQVFTVPGNYSYDCSVGSHAAAGMVGTIVVTNSIYDIVSNSTDHATLKVAIDACSLDGVLSDPGSLTLFAPTDAAFDLLPSGTVTALLADIPTLTDILKHHVVGASVMSGALSNGQVVTTLLGTDVTVTINAMGVYIDDAMVIVDDIMADNGVVHIIDAVLIPITPSNSIYDIVSNSTDHATLKVAIDACSLDGVLSDPGSLTLFAPTDAAFDLLPSGTVTALLADIPTLTDILKHHVVGASVMSGALSNGQVVTTLLGTDVTVTINAMGVYIDDAMVIVDDIMADNGVVHIIDAVLLPTTTDIIDYNNLEKVYLYSLNILGEKVSKNLKNQVVFNVFQDGSIQKVFNR